MTIDLRQFLKPGAPPPDFETLQSILKGKSESEIAKLCDEIARLTPNMLWVPFNRPQRMALETKADWIGYGGAAGGGKSDLICGLAIHHHQRSLIFRREKAQLQGIIQRLESLLGSLEGYNSQTSVWITPDRRIIEFGGLKDPDDWTRFSGRPHDLKAYDEASEMRETDVRQSSAWARTDIPNQRVRRIMTMNPPSSVEGRWIIRFFAPWLDPRHPHPASDGELRWFATIDGDPDVEVPDERPFVFVKGQRVYDFNPKDYPKEDIIRPQSRTFIQAKVSDNPVYMATGYLSTLQSLPEPHRSRLLHGSFTAGMEDDPSQVIPTRWIEDAMARWRPREEMPRHVGPMDSIGLDVARGGRDQTVIARRHGEWFDELICHPGTETSDGHKVAALVVAVRRNAAPVHADVIGWGASAVDAMVKNGIHVVPVDVSRRTSEVSRDGNMRFVNTRALLWWRMREALDPASGNEIALPPDSALLSELTSARWEMGLRGIQVEGKDEIRKRVGRSTDRADAVILALMRTAKAEAVMDFGSGNGIYDPFERDWR